MQLSKKKFKKLSLSLACLSPASFCFEHIPHQAIHKVLALTTAAAAP